MEYITEARKKQVNRIRKRRRRKRIMRRIVLMLCLVLLAAAAVKGAWFVVQTVAAGITQKTESIVSAVEETAEASSHVQEELPLPVTKLSQSEKLACILEDDSYPEKLKEMAQKNSETIDFVYNYPQLKDEVWNIDLTEESQSDQVPLLMQWDERWGYITYNGGMMGYGGCGPTTLSMVVLYLTRDASATPAAVAAYAESAGYCVPGSGSTWSLIKEGCEHYGLHASEVAMVENRIRDKLDEGCPVVVNVGPGDFTDSGHYMVIVGYDDQGFIINDPNSRTNSEKRWTFDQLNGQVRNLWAMSKV